MTWRAGPRHAGSQRGLRESGAAERPGPLLPRQSRKLICSAVKSERLRSPEAAQENVVRVPRQEHEKVVEGRQPPKTKHRQDTAIAARRPRNPGNGQPYASGADDWSDKPHGYQRPITPAEERHHDARRRAYGKCGQIDASLSRKTHLPRHQGFVLG